MIQKFMKIHPVGAELFHADDIWTDRWMDGRTEMTKLIVAIHNYAKAPKSKRQVSGFGGLQVACWPLVPKFAGSNPAEAVGFFRAKIPQHSFLRRGSKAVGPIS